MHKSTANKKTLIKLLEHLNEKQGISIYSDGFWPYPMDLPVPLRDAKNCIMLDVMIQIEKRKGIVIHIPNMTIEELTENIAAEVQNGKP